MDSSYSYKKLATTDTVSSGPCKGAQWVRVWRVTCLIMTIFFVLAACAQLNDPDPYIWIPVYVLPALLTVAIAVRPEVTENRVWRVSSVVLITVNIAGSLYLSAIVIEHLTKEVVNPLKHEEGRELGGLIVIIAWLTVCRFTSLGSTDPQKGSMNALLLMTGILALIPLVFWGICYIDGMSTKLSYCADLCSTKPMGA